MSDLEKDYYEYYIGFCKSRGYVPYEQRRITELEGENKRLRKALKPFANAAQFFSEHVHDVVAFVIINNGRDCLKVGDLRRARKEVNNN